MAKKKLLQTTPQKFNVDRSKVNVSLSKLTPDKLAKGINEIGSQKQFIESYLKSDKYRQRLTSNANEELNLNPLAFQNSDLQYGGAKRGESVTETVKRLIKGNQERLSLPKLNVGDFVIDGDGRTVGAFDKHANEVQLTDKVIGDPELEASGAHEYSHASTRGAQPYSQQFREAHLNGHIFKTPDKGGDNYIQSPTEVKARVDAVRYLLNKEGIYDARTENFTREHLKKMKSNKRLQKDFNLKQLMEQFNGGDASGNKMIYLMNTIANNTNNENTGELNS